MFFFQEPGELGSSSTTTMETKRTPSVKTEQVAVEQQPLASTSASSYRDYFFAGNPQAYQPVVPNFFGYNIYSLSFLFFLLLSTKYSFFVDRQINY